GGTAGGVRVWDLPTSQVLPREGPPLPGRLLPAPPETFPALCLAFAAKGKRLASRHGKLPHRDQKPLPRAIKIWNSDSEMPLGALTGHADGVFAVAFAADGTLLSAGRDGDVKSWDLKSKTEIATLSKWSGAMDSAALTVNGKIAVLGYAGFVKLLDT